MLISLINYGVAFCQNSCLSLKGCWEEMYTGAIYEKKNGKEECVSDGVRSNEMRKMLLLNDDQGYFFMPAHYSDNINEMFSWTADSCSFFFKENNECPYIDEAKYTINSGDKYDSLYLKSTYKNPNYWTMNLYVKRRVTIETGSFQSNIILCNSDKYVAYNHRFIKNQKPLVYNGLYKDNILTLKKNSFNFLKRMTMSDQMEVHIIDSSNIGNAIVHIFIITYDISNRQIYNISYINSYK